MKEIIRYCLAKLGYEIRKKAAADTKLIESVKEIEALCRHFLFNNFPPYDENRIYLVSRLLGTGFSEAMYIINYLHQSMKISGDICEFGVAQGCTSVLLAHEMRNSNKNIWLFDSFVGLLQPSGKDKLKDDIFNLGSIKKYAGTMSCGSYMVKEKFNEISFPDTRTKIVPGFIEKTIHNSDLPEKVCFAYIDFDFYDPILVALNFLNKVLQKNGFIVVDDYDAFSTGAKTAVDEFIAANQEKYTLSLPIQSTGKFCIIEKIAWFV